MPSTDWSCSRVSARSTASELIRSTTAMLTPMPTVLAACSML